MEFLVEPAERFRKMKLKLVNPIFILRYPAIYDVGENYISSIIRNEVMGQCAPIAERRSCY